MSATLDLSPVISVSVAVAVTANGETRRNRRIMQGQARPPYETNPDYFNTKTARSLSRDSYSFHDCDRGRHATLCKHNGIGTAAIWAEAIIAE